MQAQHTGTADDTNCPFDHDEETKAAGIPLPISPNLRSRPDNDEYAKAMNRGSSPKPKEDDYQIQVIPRAESPTVGEAKYEHFKSPKKEEPGSSRGRHDDDVCPFTHDDGQTRGSPPEVDEHTSTNDWAQKGHLPTHNVFRPGDHFGKGEGHENKHSKEHKGKKGHVKFDEKEEKKRRFHFFSRSSSPSPEERRPAHERLSPQVPGDNARVPGGSNIRSPSECPPYEYLHADECPEVRPISPPPSRGHLSHTFYKHDSRIDNSVEPYPNGLQVPSRQLFTNGFRYPPGLAYHGITPKDWEEFCKKLSCHINPHRTWWRTLILIYVFFPLGIGLAYPFKVWGEQQDFENSRDFIACKIKEAEDELFRPKGLLLRLDGPGEERGMRYMDLWHGRHVDRLPRLLRKYCRGVIDEFPGDLHAAARRAEEAEAEAQQESEACEIGGEAPGCGIPHKEEKNKWYHHLKIHLPHHSSKKGKGKNKDCPDGSCAEGHAWLKEQRKHYKSQQKGKGYKKGKTNYDKDLRHIFRAKERSVKRPRLVIESVEVLGDEEKARRHGWKQWELERRHIREVSLEEVKARKRDARERRSDKHAKSHTEKAERVGGRYDGSEAEGGEDAVVLAEIDAPLAPQDLVVLQEQAIARDVDMVRGDSLSVTPDERLVVL